MKTLYRIADENIYGELYVDEQGDYVHYFHENDAKYRSEYMDPLIEYFDGEIVDIDIDWDKVEDLEDATFGEEFMAPLQSQIEKFISKRNKKKK